MQSGSKAIEPMPDRKPQRLNLRFRAPATALQHPEHIVRREMIDVREGDTVIKTSKFTSFQDWLEREGRFGLETGDADPRLTDEEAFREATLRNRIAEAAKPGGVLSEGRCTFNKPEDVEEPPRYYTHQDRLVTHARYFQKLMSQERTKHLKAAKECAEKAAAFVKLREERAYKAWKQVQPKTAEEISQEQDELYKDIYKQLVLDLNQKWFMVAEIVEGHRRTRWEAEQERLGNEALNEVIENARGSLNKRRRRLSEIGSDEDSDGNAEASEVSEDDASSSEAGDESNMSTSQSDSDAEEEATMNDDEGLTIEQLRQKYENAAASPARAPPSTTADDAIRQDIDQNGLLPRREAPKSPVRELNESQSQGLLHQHDELSLDNAHNSLLDESDHSTNMDDDDDDSEEHTSDGASDSGDGSDEGITGLMGFYGRKAFQKEVEPGDVGGSLSREGEPDPDVKEEPFIVQDLVQGPTPSATTSEEPRLLAEQGLLEARDMDDITTPHSLGGKPSSLSQEVDGHSSASPEAQTLTRETSPLMDPLSNGAITTTVPSLLRGTLREYQHYGLDWLAKLYANNEHGILADEMGLGKTIQTIALLAHLAVHYEIWGPHLIIVPTSVMLNWEMEFKKFLPGFKILTYYGTMEERKKKRQGMSDNDKWNVWITSYQLVTNDQQVFKRKAWHYMILDEAHNIKNFQSLRWQTLLTVRTHSRLLLTGTPLQNNLTELWSLLFFLEPEKCLDLEKFNKHFKRPESQILENGRDAMNSQSREMVTKLHDVLRPHLLRRLKADVEKQLPGKYEHVIYCRLSKRQRYLYDGFMSRAQTKESLASGNSFSIMNALMQLRKVCNHPDLFETHSIKTSFAMPKSAVADFEIKELLVRRRVLAQDPMTQVDLNVINLLPGATESLSALDTIQRQRLGALGTLRQLASQQWQRIDHSASFDGSTVDSSLSALKNVAKRARFEDLRHSAYLISLRSQRRPLFSHALMQKLRFTDKNLPHPPMPIRRSEYSDWMTKTSPALCDMVKTLPERSTSLETTISKFACITPKVVATDMTDLTLTAKGLQAVENVKPLFVQDPYHEARVRLSIAFPDKRLLQYDCGKLQRLDGLLRTLQSGGHRALIFTQMTKVLDILEQFLNIHGHRYLRLDGATKVDQRQALTERFNNDPRILAFILSSRSGGIGINLTGADTVIFYDMDWNPAMDKQCQDRCHRIGQTRDVHIYRMISEHTIEANILRKASQKRMLDDIVIQEGDFTTDYFNNITVKDIVGDEALGEEDADANAAMDRVISGRSNGRVLEQVEDVEDIQAAKLAEKEIEQNQDAADFDEKGIASAGASTPKTPATPSETMPPPHHPSTILKPSQIGGDAVERTATMDALDSGLASATAAARAGEDHGETELDQEEPEPPSCDDFMIRMLEWEFKDVPYDPPEEDKKKKKKAKKGKEHIVPRKR